MNEQRRQYLKAMGIQVWESRRPSDGKSPPWQGGDIEGVSSGRSDDPLLPPPNLPLSKGEEQKDSPAPPLTDRVQRIAQMNWEELRAEVDTCTACPLHATRTQAVFGVGNRQARWMIIGEAPGADEDRLGEPFVGKAGKLLDAMLLSLGLDREKVFIANILKSRPPNNRDPLPEEVAACWPFLNRQIALIRPKIILAVGRIAAQQLLQTDVAVGKLRGRVHRLGANNIPLIVTYHPAYLLRSPREKRKAWDDLQLARRTLTNETETR